MDPATNPFAPGAGTPPPELAGRDELLETVRVAIARVRAGRSAKSVLMVGLRGVGQDRAARPDAGRRRGRGIQTVRIEAPEGRSLPALLAPELRRRAAALSREERGEGLGDARAACARRLRQGAQGQVPGHRGRHRLRSGAGPRGQRRPGARPAGAARGRRRGRAARRARRSSLFIDELQYVEEDQLAALITALHRVAQRQLPVVAGRRRPAAAPRTDGPREVICRAALRLPGDRSARRGPRRAAPSSSRSRDRAPTSPTEAVSSDRRRDAGLPVLPPGVGKARMGRGAGSPITPRTSTLASATAIAALDASFFRVRFDRLTPAEKRYLRAMAELGPGPASLRRHRRRSSAQRHLARHRRAAS